MTTKYKLKNTHKCMVFHNKNGEIDQNSIYLGLGVTVWNDTFEHAILLASTRLKGKYHPEWLAEMLRDPDYELTAADRNLLADFVEGKLKNKPGRSSHNSPFSIIENKLSPEMLVAYIVAENMKNSKANGHNMYGKRSTLINKFSESYGASAVKVEEILRKGRAPK